MQQPEDPRFVISGQPIQFFYNGKTVSGFEGQSIAAALTAQGIRTFSHDKAGNARGIFCGMGVCYECVVNIEGQGNTRACLTPARSGINVSSTHYLRDAAAPDSELSDSTPATDTEPQPPITATHTDVAVIGAGPAGLSAAITLQNHEIPVMVIDERTAPGGQYFKPLAASHSFTQGFTDRQYAHGSALIDELKSGKTEIVLGTTVCSAEKQDDSSIKLIALTGTQCRTITCKRLLIATGTYEKPCIFPGWTLSGVMTTGAAQSLLRSYRAFAGSRIVIAGNGPLNLQLAAELVQSGAHVVAVVESSPFSAVSRFQHGLAALISSPGLIARGLRYLAVLRQAGVPVYSKHHLIRATGTTHLEAIEISPLGSNADGELCTENSDPITLAANTLCLGYGFLPNSELAKMLGCRFEKNMSSGTLIPMRSESGRTTEPDVFLIGDGGQLSGAPAALLEGRLAAWQIIDDLRGSALSLSSRAKTTHRGLKRQHRFQRALWKLFNAPPLTTLSATGDTMVCRCEGVSLSDIERLKKKGITDHGDIKRRTRLAMGRCQGRYCTPLLAKVLESEQKNNNHTGFTVQTPIKPMPIGSYSFEVPEWKGYKPEPVLLPDPEEVAVKSLAKQAKPGNSNDIDTTQIPLPAQVDTLIIGAGVIGSACGYYLTQRGHQVLIVDAGQLNNQASGGNAGSLHLQSLSFDYKTTGRPQDALPFETLRLQKHGIALWQSLERDLNTNFQLRITGGLMVAETQEQMRFLEDKIAAEAKVGINVELLSGEEARKIEPALSSTIIGASYCAGEGKIDPLLATPAISSAFTNAGGEVFLNTKVGSIDARNQHFSVNTNLGTVRCRNVVNAAGAWSADIAKMAGVQLPVLSAPQQMIVTEPLQPLCSHLLAHAGRHLTMKQSQNGNLLIGGGWFASGGRQNMRARPVNDAIAGNLWVAQRVLPAISACNVIRSWAAAGVMIDGGPIIGESASQPGVYHAVGANGYTMAPVIGKIIADLIATKRTDISIAPFSADRFIE